METLDKKNKEFVVEGYIIKNNKILLIFHKKLNLWLPPGGHVEKWETPEVSLIREVKEETGLNVEIIKQIIFKNDFNVKILPQPTHIQLENINKTHYHIDMVYVCRVKKGSITKNNESKNIKFFTLTEIENLNTTKEVKYFAKKFIDSEADRSKYRLPVLKKIVDSCNVDFSNVSLLIIQHIKKNTIEFIRLLKSCNFKESIIISKPYSIDREALKEIKKISKVITPSFKDLENLKIIDKVIQRTIKKQNKFICLDLGGYFSKYFQKLNNVPNNLIGVIEDTKNGIWFDEKNVKLKFPLLSVANSKLKNYAENQYVAKAIIRNSENILINSDLRQSLYNKKILLLGYGRIGEIIARILKNETEISVHDILPSKLLKAKIDGFDILDNLNNLFNFDILIGITGNTVLKKQQLLNLKNGAILINGSTRQKEFDIKSISHFLKNKIKNETYTVYQLCNQRRFYLLSDGYPVNFLNTESIPEFIIDLIFSEIFMLIQLLKEKNISPGFYPIEKNFSEIEDKISKIWLDYWK